MFSQLRQGQEVLLLHKSGKPYVESARIESVSNMSMMGYYPNMIGMPVDISVRVGDRTVNYQRLPAQAETADVVEQTSGEAVTIACSRESMTSEVQVMRQKSIDTISSIDYHKERIAACDAIISQLNPAEAEKAAQQQELCQLRSQVDSLTQSIQELLRHNRELEASSSPKTK